MRIKMILILILLILILIFSMQNLEMVSIRLLFWEVTLSRGLWFFIIFLGGTLAGWLLGALGRYRQHKISGKVPH